MVKVAQFTDTNPDGLTATVWQMGAAQFTVAVVDTETKTGIERRLYPELEPAIAYARKVCNVAAQ